MESKESKRTLRELDEEEKREQERLAVLAEVEYAKSRWDDWQMRPYNMALSVAERGLTMNYEWFKEEALQYGLSALTVYGMWIVFKREIKARYGYFEPGHRPNEIRKAWGHF